MEVIIKQYCQACGNPTQYTSNPPRFCAECGHPFSGATQAKSVRRPAPPPQLESDDEEIDSSPVVIPEKLSVRVEGGRREKVTIGQIAFTQPTTEKLQRPSGPKLSKKKFLEQFRQEAGGGGTQSVQIGGSGD